MKNIRKLLACFSLMTVGVLLIAAPDTARAEANEKKIIEQGVCIGNLPVGGMTEEEAASALRSYLDDMKDTVFTLKGPNGSMELSAADMEITADTERAVEDAMDIGHTGNLISQFKVRTDLKTESYVVNMHLSVDKEKTAQQIYEHTDELNIEAEDNSLTRANGEFQFVPGKSGVEVNIVDSVYALNDYLGFEWSDGDNEYTLVSEEVQPRGSQEELAQVKDLLGSFSTNFASSAAGRAQNVRNACSKINGTVLFPEDEFSTYAAISPFTVENGYAMAGSYSNGQVVESLGGGVCQVATTLYNAIIRAELDISMRYNHSMLVSYVPPSNDAAIAGTYKDLRFVNNLEYPVYIEGYCEGGIITFNVYGVEMRPSNREISFESETVSERQPNTQYNFTSSQSVGYYSVSQGSHKGLVARLWKVVKEDGVEVSREIFNNSTYNASPRTVTIGIGGASAQQAAAIKSAASSGNEASVKSAISRVKEEIKAAQEKKKAEEEKKKEEEEKKKAEEEAEEEKTEEGKTEEKEEETGTKKEDKTDTSDKKTSTSDKKTSTSDKKTSTSNKEDKGTSTSDKKNTSTSDKEDKADSSDN